MTWRSEAFFCPECSRERPVGPERSKTVRRFDHADEVIGSGGDLEDDEGHGVDAAAVIVRRSPGDDTDDFAVADDGSAHVVVADGPDRSPGVEALGCRPAIDDAGFGY